MLVGDGNYTIEGGCVRAHAHMCAGVRQYSLCSREPVCVCVRVRACVLACLCARARVSVCVCVWSLESSDDNKPYWDKCVRAGFPGCLTDLTDLKYALVYEIAPLVAR